MLEDAEVPGRTSQQRTSGRDHPVSRSAGHRSGRSGVGAAQHPQVAAPADLHRLAAPAAARGGPPRAPRRPAPRGRRCSGPSVSGSGASRSTSQPRGRGEPLGVGGAQVVAVRLGVGGQRAEDGGRVGVDVGERRDRRATAGGPRTAADGAHGRTVPTGGPAAAPTRPRAGAAAALATLAGCEGGAGTAGPSAAGRARTGPATATGAAAGCAARWPPGDLPVSRTRAEQFDELVLAAVSRLESRWATELADVEVLVEDVPDAGDRDVPLGRTEPATPRRPGPDRRLPAPGRGPRPRPAGPRAPRPRRRGRAAGRPARPRPGHGRPGGLTAHPAGGRPVDRSAGDERAPRRRTGPGWTGPEVTNGPRSSASSTWRTARTGPDPRPGTTASAKDSALLTVARSTATWVALGHPDLGGLARRPAASGTSRTVAAPRGAVSSSVLVTPSPPRTSATTPGVDAVSGAVAAV